MRKDNPVCGPQLGSGAKQDAIGVAAAGIRSYLFASNRRGCILALRSGPLILPAKERDVSKSSEKHRSANASASRTSSPSAPSQASHSPKPSSSKAERAREEHPPITMMMTLRGWIDALVIAYILAMFIRTYAVELFKIPTGSMTPTLVGDDEALEYDYDGDGEKDLILFNRPNTLHVFLRKNGEYSGQLYASGVPYPSAQSLRTQAGPRHDMILVNKFLYWLRPPQRGEIIVFKVPNRPELDRSPDPSMRNPWNPKTPIFIKRCIGLPGDRLDVAPPTILEALPGEPGHIGRIPAREYHIKATAASVNGQVLTQPPVMKRGMHFPFGFGPWNLILPAQSYKVPEGQIFMMGDNSSNSTDSRAWGGVPLENVRGRAILRYYPFSKISFLQ